MDHHEAAAADIAGARISDRKREADRDGGIDRIAAAVENFHADARGMALLRHHHAVVGEDRRRRRNDRRARRWRDLGVGGGAGEEREKKAAPQRALINTLCLARRGTLAPPQTA